jgi:hypothetical protein
VRTCHIAWWILENLFDEEDAAALGRRTDKGFRAIKNDIAGWTPQLRDRKIEQLASVIAAMNTGQGPDLLGVCEVENRFVMDRLVEKVNSTSAAPRSYAVVHADSDDARGIDVAFVYDDTLLHVPLPVEESVYLHVVMRRHATREIGQVNFKTTTAAARTWAVFGNHWPSRSGGQFESEGLPRHCRGDAGLLPPAGPRSSWGADTGTGVGGLQRRTVRHLSRAACAQHPAAGQGHLGAGGATVVELDVADRRRARWQLLLRHPTQHVGPVPREQEHGRRRCPDQGGPAHGADLQTAGHGQSRRPPKPIPFAEWASRSNQNGFSDHFPVTMTVTEVDWVGVGSASRWPAESLPLRLIKGPSRVRL